MKETYIVTITKVTVIPATSFLKNDKVVQTEVYSQVIDGEIDIEGVILAANKKVSQQPSPDTIVF